MPDTPPDNREGFPPFAFLNTPFMESDTARPIRLVAEYMEPEERFEKEGVKHTVVVFGSARIKPPEVAQENLRRLQEEAKASGEFSDNQMVALQKARDDCDMAAYYKATEELCFQLTRWSMAHPNPEERFTICTGGGPGIMEAANRGSHRAGGKSIGLNIDIPTEQKPNPYITPELGFHFRYFFMRKLWFTSLARVLVCFPGGIGTLDELFEILTLIKTDRMKTDRPVILFGSDYWKNVINFDTMVKYGTIGPDIHNAIVYVDRVEDAYTQVVEQFEAHFVKGSTE